MAKRNTTFTILSCIAMITVLLGHLGCDVLTFWGTFPYYSYHVMIFVFIAGYFYKTESEDKIPSYILHKVKTLMLPYFIWNIIYGILANLLHGCGFEIGEQLNLWNILVAPFVGGHQFMYNAAAWFVPALFLLEVCNVFGRKILGFVFRKEHSKEWLIFIIYLFVGCFAVFMAKRGSVYNYYKIPGRLMVMAPCMQMGRLYREKLEKYDVMTSILYFALLLTMNIILTKTHGGLAYSVVWVTGFANTPLTPFITAFTGIMLWLRASKLLANLIDSMREKGKSRLVSFVDYFGSHTYAVMMHQLVAFMIVKAVFSSMARSGVEACRDFDILQYHTDVYYTFLPNGNELFVLIYLSAGIGISLLLAYLLEKVRRIKK